MADRMRRFWAAVERFDSRPTPRFHRFMRFLDGLIPSKLRTSVVEDDRLPALVKWVAIASVVVAFVLAVILDNWFMLFSVPSMPVYLYIMQRRGRF